MTESISDGDIIRACQKGSDDAFTQLVGRYQDKAFWVGYNLLGNTEEARDVAQEAFVRIFRAIDRFDFNMSFYTWLYRIVTNLAIDRLRATGDQGFHLSIRRGEMLDVLLTRNVCTGATMGFRSEYRSILIFLVNLR